MAPQCNELDEIPWGFMFYGGIGLAPQLGLRAYQPWIHAAHAADSTVSGIARQRT